MIFQRGERITLVHTDDPHTRLRPGDAGTVTRHDQTATGDVVHVAWDDGSRLSMCLDSGDIITRIPQAPAGPRPDQPAAGGCLLGELDTDGHRYTAVPVARPTVPGDMIPALRYFWRHKARGESGRFTNWVLTNGWARFDPAGQATTGHGERIFGIGVVDPDPAAAPVHGDLHHPTAGPHRPGWLYLLDPDWEQIVVYEATVHGRWALHSRQDLHAPPASPLAGPEPPAGDAATAAGHVHRWREATVALPGLDEGWPAQICTTELLRGQVVARLHPEVLAAVIRAADRLYRDRRAGSLLPTLVLDTYIPQGLQVTWYVGSGHEQTHRIEPDQNRRLVVGPHILPWTLPAETTTGGDHTALVNGVPVQVREWVTEAGFGACNPGLAGYPLPLVCAAIAACCPTMTAVIATSTTDLGGPVWLVAASHALMVTPTSYRPEAGRVRLPRPLAGTWAADPPVQVLTPEQVATTCAAMADGFTALTGAATPNPSSSTQDYQ